MAADANPHVLVDLTPALPGGRNGGIGTLVDALVTEFAGRAGGLRFTLICDTATAGRFEDLAGGQIPVTSVDFRSLRRWRRLHRFAAAAGPLARPLDRPAAVLGRLRPDVVFSPYGGDTFAGLGVPFVPVVVDLQPFDLPENFSDRDRAGRVAAIENLIDSADEIAAISDFTRDSIVRTFPIEPSRVTTIPIAPPPRRVGPGDDAAITRLGLARGGYWLYPANFWPHKNHATLLRAFADYRSRSPGGGKLVLTGCDTGRGRAVRGEADRLGLGDAVRFAGYVDDAELAGLLAGCRALLFPSRYEGFGIPVVEAFAAGRPVLCSAAGSLPEVAGDAAVLFDPDDPDAIASAMRAFDRGEPDAERMIERGTARHRALGTPAEMAARYRDLLVRAAGCRLVRRAA